MRVLTSSVLVMEAIMLGLAVPVVLVARDQPTAVAWLIGGLALACLILPGMARRSWYVPVGWVLQAAVVACGVFEPMLAVLGAIFAVLWGVAVRLGRRTDAARSSAGAVPGR